MNNFDDLAWKREFDRVEARQKRDEIQDLDTEQFKELWAQNNAPSLFDDLEKRNEINNH